MSSRQKNGRFVKRKIAERNKKASECMLKAKKRKVEDLLKQEKTVVEGKRIVELSELAKHLKCSKCKDLLDLTDIQEEKQKGLHSILTIKCNGCDTLNLAHTGKTSNNIAHNNASFILGAIHSGVGSTSLNKILACADMPSISKEMYKRYENIIGPAIEAEAKESCKRAALDEKKLVIENIQKLCEQLPEDIVKDIYPQLDILNSSLQTEGATFDEAVGNVTNIIVSFDTAWSKRGNGRNYDSLNGYSAIIGFLSGKILDFTTRNRKCRMCELGHNKSDHNCRLNFKGSAKAMEADAGVELVNRSKILQESRLKVRVIVGDEDSSMIAAVRKDDPNTSFHKLADKNHLIKNFANQLYKMRDKYKQLNRKGVINHIKKLINFI